MSSVALPLAMYSSCMHQSVPSSNELLPNELLPNELYSIVGTDLKRSTLYKQRVSNVSSVALPLAMYSSCMHQSVPSSKFPPPPPPEVLRLFLARVPGICTIRIAWGSDLLSIIKVPSCLLMLHEDTFQLQTDLPSIAAI